MSAPDYTTIADARDRDREHDRQMVLRQQLRMLSEGRLLYAPEQTYERPQDLEARIAELTQQRERAKAALDAHLREAEQLLGTMVTT